MVLGAAHPSLSQEESTSESSGLQRPGIPVAPQPQAENAVSLTPAEASRGAFSQHWADVFNDQKRIWTSPAHVRFVDTTWLVPLGGIAAGLFVTERQYGAPPPQHPRPLPPAG